MTDELDQLRRATVGLLYPSESDEPFETVCWKTPEADPAKAVAKQVRPGTTIQEQPVDAFFADLEASEDAQRFRQLRQVLESTLSNLKVFRAGEVEVDVFLIGRARDGAWCGLRTKSVET